VYVGMTRARKTLTLTTGSVPASVWKRAAGCGRPGLRGFWRKFLSRVGETVRGSMAEIGETAVMSRTANILTAVRSFTRRVRWNFTTGLRRAPQRRRRLRQRLALCGGRR